MSRKNFIFILIITHHVALLYYHFKILLCFALISFCQHSNYEQLCEWDLIALPVTVCGTFYGGSSAEGRGHPLKWVITFKGATCHPQKYHFNISLISVSVKICLGFLQNHITDKKRLNVWFDHNSTWKVQKYNSTQIKKKGNN